MRVSANSALNAQPHTCEHISTLCRERHLRRCLCQLPTYGLRELNLYIDNCIKTQLNTRRMWRVPATLQLAKSLVPQVQSQLDFLRSDLLPHIIGKCGPTHAASFATAKCGSNQMHTHGQHDDMAWGTTCAPVLV